MALFMFPTLILTRGKTNQMYAILFVGFLVMSVCIALTWLPYWILLIVGLLVASLWSGKIKGWTT